MTTRYVHTIWCDDIRQELGNKPSFMGVYTGGIVLPELPTVLPRLSIWTIVSSPTSQPIRNISVSVKRDDGAVLLEIPESEVRGDDAPAPIEGRTAQVLMFGMTIVPVEIPAGCKHFQVVVSADGEELLGPQLWIQVNPGFLAQIAAKPGSHDREPPGPMS